MTIHLTTSDYIKKAKEYISQNVVFTEAKMRTTVQRGYKRCQEILPNKNRCLPIVTSHNNIREVHCSIPYHRVFMDNSNRAKFKVTVIFLFQKPEKSRTIHETLRREEKVNTSF